MGVIKTALEIALEKTDSIKSDKTSITQYEARQQGKKLANEYLSGEADITGELKKASGADREYIKQGVFDILVTQIALPSSQEDAVKVEKAVKGLESVIKSKEFSAMVSQLTQVLNQYLQESAQYEQAIRQQYAPKLRQKEEELSRRYGREVRIDPMQDPEFTAFYNQNMNALKSNYEGIIEQAKSEAKRLFEK